MLWFIFRANAYLVYAENRSKSIMCPSYTYIPRPSRCAFFLPFAEIAIYCVVCSKKSLCILKVLLQNLAKTWSANVAFWSLMSPLGRAMSPFRLHPGFAKRQICKNALRQQHVSFAPKGAFGPNSTKKAYLGGPRYIFVPNVSNVSLKMYVYIYIYIYIFVRTHSQLFRICIHEPAFVI